jgi:hypothetical protein
LRVFLLSLKEKSLPTIFSREIEFKEECESQDSEEKR